ncbi:MAG: hypothetical protein FWD19_02355, partial [Defluviitaleaceae bacterium]|nr:hypothetical protein [Defluviitaleaceae bacterium]
MNPLLLFFYCFFMLLPCAWLCYGPFTENLSRSKKKVSAECAVISFFISLLCFPLVHIFGTGGADITGFIYMSVSFFYFRKTVNEGFHKLLFVFIVVAHFASIISGIRYTVCIYLNLPVSLEEATSLFFFIDYFLRITLYPVMWMVLRRWFAPRLKQIDSQNMKGLWLIPLIFFILGLFTWPHYNPASSDENLIFLSAFFVLSVPSFPVYILLLKILDNTAKNT